MKKTLVALAAVSLLAPLAAQAAGTSSTLVGSLRYGLAYSDPGDGADGDFSSQNFGSRIKWAGSSDLGTGTTAFGQLELRLNSARNSNVVNRHYRVGLEGDFGKVSLGLQDSAFDLVNPDPSWWNGGAGLGGNRAEKPGTVKYENSFGDVAFAAAVTAETGDTDNDFADLFDIAAKYSANGITLGAGMQTLAGDAASAHLGTGDGSAFAITGGYNFGAGWFDVTFGVEDEDFNAVGGSEVTNMHLNVVFGDVYGWFGSKETDGGNTPTGMGIGYTQSLGPKTLIWYELFQNDADDGSDADLGINMALKLDF